MDSTGCDKSHRASPSSPPEREAETEQEADTEEVTEAETFRISRLWEEIHGTVPGEEEAQKLFSIFEDKLMSILHLYADPKPGVTEAVELLREKGIKIGSTTGYTDKMMEIAVPAAASKGWFHHG